MNGRWYDALTAGPERRLLAPLRAQSIGTIRGDVIELGAGTGLNFPHYSSNASVRAIEPDSSMRARATKRAAAALANIELLPGDDTQLDALGEHTVDTVVATLVFCSVEDPGITLRRIRRVLKPGGTLIAMEHVRGHGAWGTMQSVLTPAWRRLAGNCHLDRDFEACARESGFAPIDLCSYRLPPPLCRMIVVTAIASRSLSARQQL